MLPSHRPLVAPLHKAPEPPHPIGPGTVDPQMLGSGRYRFKAPEQLLGSVVTFGPSTDAFALGVTAYWLMTGTLPYSNVTSSRGRVMEVFRNEYEAAMNTCRTLRLPSPALGAMQRLLAPAVEDRPEGLDTISEMFLSHAESP